MVLLSGIIGTVASVWLYYNFCGWLNILNCTLPPVGMILVLAYFMNKEDFETDQPKLKTVDWFAVAGVILGAIVANLLHWGIASINGMVVAAVCYCVGQAVNKENEQNRPEYVPVSYLRNMFRAFYFSDSRYNICITLHSYNFRSERKLPG